MKIKNKILIAVLIIMMLMPLMNSFKDILAASYALPYVGRSDLSDHKGKSVTGEDIVKAGFYLGHKSGFTYSNVGTCTGFVTRIFRFLEIDQRLASNQGWDKFYTLNNWDVPGSHGAPGYPSWYMKQAQQLCREGNAQYIGAVIVDNGRIVGVRKAIDGYYGPTSEAQWKYNDSIQGTFISGGMNAIDQLEIQDGDFLVTPEIWNGRTIEEGPDRDGHVAFAAILEGHARTLGAGSSGIHAGDIGSFQSNKDGNTFIYRLVKSTGNLKVVKVDEFDKPVAGVTMKITDENGATVKNTDGTDIFTTDANGEIYIEGLTAGNYYITEVSAPSNLITVIDEIPVAVGAGDEKVTTVRNNYKRGKARLQKVDALDGAHTRGDATFAGAEYTLYAKNDIVEGVTHRYSADEVVARCTTNIEGYTDTVENLPLGEYYWVETTAPNGYVRNSEKLYFTISIDDNEVTKGSSQEIVGADQPINGRARVVKFNNDDDSSEKSPAAGAVLRMTLVSSKTAENPDGIYYEVTLNENGEGEFIDKEFKNAHPEQESTIPYGTYEVTEIAESKDSALTHYFIKPLTFKVEEKDKLYPFQLSDEMTDSYIRIVKKDEVTKEIVKKVGAKFKIWDVEKKEFVKFMMPLSGELFTELEATDEGYVNTPSELKAGKEYRIYETAAPEGYLVNPKYALPENKADYGKKNGYKFIINKDSLNVPENIIYDKDNKLVLVVPIEDPRPMVKLTVHKTGERFTEVAQDSVTYKTGDNANENRTENRYTPVFKEQPLPGVTFNVVTTERVLNPNKDGSYVEAGTVVDTITTNAGGNATTIDLFPGTYKLVETKTQNGYIVKENIDPITLTNDGKETPVKEFNVDLANDRQKLGLTFPKSFEKVKFITGDKVEQKATFAIYANEDIVTYDGKVKIPKDGLVDLIEIEGNDNVTSKIDLPEGKYYAREVYVSYPYSPYGDKIEFSLTYKNNNQPYVIIEGKEIINTYETSSVSLIKISSSSMQSVVMKGKEIDKSKLDEEIKEIINSLQGMTEDEVRKYFKDNKIITVAGATYGIYTDAECKNILKILNEETGKYEEAKMVTDNSGMIKLEGLPVGSYYIKELAAPNGYEISKEVVNVNLTLDNRDEMVFDALKEDKVVSEVFTKIDVFDGEEIPNCVFDILDEDGNSVLKVETSSKTDDKGKAYIPSDLFEEGKTYYYKEISAPEEYDLNPELHSFVAKFNEKGEFIGERVKVDNTRKSKELRVLKVDEKTGEPLKGCVFSIALLDKDGNIKTREDGSTVYLVENAVTDENGEYIIEKVYYGTYKFTEVQAPENYELSEKDMEGYVFTVDENSPDRIDFIITNTGDIAVIAIAVVAVVCVLGIVFVIVRNKKATK